MPEQNIKIVMVEDEVDLADIYSLKLKQCGFNVIPVHDGQGAFEVVKKEMPDAVLLDIFLPNVDGYAILEKLRQDPKTKKLKIFAWSNFTQDKEIAKAKKIGVESYLIKSDYTPSTLAEKIKELMKLK